ncbi:HNH endonuclease [Ferrovum myxofaciens]|uniref:HNH endonuclease n=1 Tax=Ferrovum myxofaciens TaxID=416213 RepID=UPI002353218B|nr:HNH endonuclease signature motif containing protein [Ferrovum myxofaciens]MBU6993709.1 HNH endonuclease [Ferrovum myxofaciens]
MNSYTFYWNNKTWEDRKRETKALIKYVGGKNQWPFSEVGAGDEIFVVTAKNNCLYVGGRLIANGSPIKKTEAARLLPSEQLIDKERYVVANLKLLDIFQGEVSLGATEVQSLEIIDKDGKIGHKKFGPKSFQQDFRNPTKITESSASKLREKLSISVEPANSSGKVSGLASKSETPEEDIRIRESGGVDMTNSTMDKEQPTVFSLDEINGAASDAATIDVALEGFDGEDRDVLAKRRVNQGKFRAALLRYWDSRCCVSGVDDPRLLVASHIVSWSKATKSERGDPANGLLLSVTWDALFDRGLISFRDDGTAILDKLDGALITQLGIDMSKTAIPSESLSPKHREYLGRHRKLYGYE